METEYANILKKIHHSFLEFIENDHDIEERFQNVFTLIHSNNIIDNKHKFKSFLYLISNIANNHHRSDSFFGKIDRILLMIKDNIKKQFSISEIFKIFRGNKRILLFFIEEQIFKIDMLNRLTMNFKQYKNYSYSEYFQPEIENSDPTSKKIDKSKYNLLIINRRIGENDDYICQSIRDNDLNEFKSILNRENLNFNAKIVPSIFETNPFLIKNSPSLIEYAAFHGSIDIFLFLINKVSQLSPSIWLYAIHGRKINIIKNLENLKIKPEDGTFEKCLKESIKCHHNEIAEYIMSHLINQENESIHKKIVEFAFHYHNYIYFPSNFNNDSIYRYLCEYDYIDLMSICLKTKFIDVNPLIVLAKKKENKEMVDFLTLSIKKSNIQIINEGKHDEMKIFSVWKQEIDGSVVITEEARYIFSASQNPCVVLFFGNLRTGKSTISSHLVAGPKSDISQTFFKTAGGTEPCTRNINAIGPIKCKQLAEQFDIPNLNPENPNWERDIFIIDSEGMNSPLHNETIWLKKALISMLPVNTISFYVTNSVNLVDINNYKKHLKLMQVIGKTESYHAFGFISNVLNLQNENTLEQLMQTDEKMNENMLIDFNKTNFNFDKSHFRYISVLSINHHRNEYFMSLAHVARFIIETCLKNGKNTSGQNIVDMYNGFAEKLKDADELRNPNADMADIIMSVLTLEMKRSIRDLTPMIEQEIADQLKIYKLGQIKEVSLDQLMQKFVEKGFVEKVINQASIKFKPYVSEYLPKVQQISRDEAMSLIKEMAQLKLDKKIDDAMLLKCVGQYGLNALVVVVALIGVYYSDAKDILIKYFLK